MGMSVSDAVRMLLVRVIAEKALPFDVKVPNATTVKRPASPPRATEDGWFPRGCYLRLWESDPVSRSLG